MNHMRCSTTLAARISLKDMRKSIRVHGCFPAWIRGFDKSGRAFHESFLVDNISSGGLFVQLNRPVAEGSRLFAAVQLASGATIAARGLVSRVEQRPHNLTGVAVRFTRARLLPWQGIASLAPSTGTLQ